MIYFIDVFLLKAQVTTSSHYTEEHSKYDLRKYQMRNVCDITFHSIVVFKSLRFCFSPQQQTMRELEKLDRSDRWGFIVFFVLFFFSLFCFGRRPWSDDRRHTGCSSRLSVLRLFSVLICLWLCLRFQCLLDCCTLKKKLQVSFHKEVKRVYGFDLSPSLVFRLLLGA